MVITMGTIFFLSHQPGDTIELYPIPGIDKLAHLCIYGLLACTILYGFGRSYRISSPYKVMIIVISVSLLYGVLDEFHQSFIPYRSVSSLDIIADFSGAVLVCLLWDILRKKENFERYC